MPTSSGADLSCSGSPSRVAPLAIEGVGDVDTEACPITTSTKDALGADPSIHPAVDMATCMDDGSGHAASAHDVKDTTGHAAPATGVPNMPSSDAAINRASPIDAVAAPNATRSHHWRGAS